MDKLSRIKELIKLINKYNYDYYTLDNPVVSDKEYDDLYYELVALEKETGIVLDDSPTKKVGDVVLDKFKKVKHEKKLYSLNKANSFEELENWFNSMQSFGAKKFSLEYKYDGLRVVIKYVDGNMVQCATRGNGLVGEDVTAQIKTIKNVPQKIPFKGVVIVMGEVLMRLSQLKKYNKENSEPLKNARNAAAGGLRNLDTSVTASRNLDAFMYDILYISDNLKSQLDVHNFLNNQGFDTFDFYNTFDNIQDIFNVINKVDGYKSNLDILIDGMVLKVDNLEIRDKIGYTEKYPKWAIAYKFEAQELTSIVKNVFWQVGRTGKLTPICEIEPIELAGATVSKATLNNMQDIIRKDVKIGSSVFVRRSNEVIPEILGVAEHSKNSIDINKPEICPCCGNILYDDGINLYCQNKYCPDRLVGVISHYASKDAMNIEGLSEKTARLLYDNLNLRSISDLYDLDYNKLSILNGFKDKKIKNLLKNIENSKNVPLENFIYALGINGVGIKTAKDISKKFKTFDNFRFAKFDDFVGIKDIGNIIANNICKYLENDENISLINSLFSNGIKIVENNSINILDNIFKDKTVVITGTNDLLSRDDATKYVELLGGKVSSAVSSKTDFLICGKNAGSKFDKANKLGIKIVDFDYLINELLKNNIKITK